MHILQATAGDFLRLNGRYYRLDQYDYACNELGIRIGGVDYSNPDYEPFTPPRITEQGQYTAAVFGDSCAGSTMSMYLVLSEHGGEFHGFRHRFQVNNYGVNIPIVFKSTDSRIKEATQGWHVRSGQFFIYVKSNPQGVWTFKTGVPSMLRIDNMTNWINVPSQ